MADSNFEFSSRLKQAIQHAGITQKSLAIELSVEQGSISRYVSQGRVPEWDILVKLADRLSVSCDWLLKGEEPTDGSRKKPGLVTEPGGLSKQEEDLLGKALEVLRSKKTEGAFDHALKSSIEALHAAVKNAEGIKRKKPGSPRAKKAKKGAAKDAGS